MAGENLEVVFRNHYEPLCAVAARYVGSSGSAEDVVHDVFARLWERPAIWQKCREEPQPHRYVYIAVRNQALKHRRHDRLAGEVQRAMKRLGRPLGSSQSGARPDEEAQASELASAFRACVDRLPDRCRETFRRHWNGMGRAEIAERMGTSVRTVETQVSRAKNVLRRELSAWL